MSRVYLARTYYSDGSGQEMLGVYSTPEAAEARIGRHWIESGMSGEHAEVVPFDLDDEKEAS